MDGDIQKLAAGLKDANSLLLFGRGYNYATALEAALKVCIWPYLHSYSMPVVCCSCDIACNLPHNIFFARNCYSSLQILLVCRLPITDVKSLLQGSWHVVLTMSVLTEDITEYMYPKVSRL